jgi:hypothetical protein
VEMREGSLALKSINTTTSPQYLIMMTVEKDPHQLQALMSRLRNPPLGQASIERGFPGS